MAAEQELLPKTTTRPWRFVAIAASVFPQTHLSATTPAAAVLAEFERSYRIATPSRADVASTAWSRRDEGAC